LVFAKGNSRQQTIALRTHQRILGTIVLQFGANEEFVKDDRIIEEDH